VETYLWFLRGSLLISLVFVVCESDRRQPINVTLPEIL
jgi:hypothetical protein